MSAKYFPGLFNSYQPLRGSKWIQSLDQEGLQVFVDIGLKANNHGKLGGCKLVEKRGKEHMSKIGRIGAIATNSIRAWHKAVKEEMERELGVTYDY